MNSKNIARAMLFVAMIALNSWASFDSPVNAEDKFVAADFKILPGFKLGVKTYDSTGKWDGCKSGPKKECVMISIPHSTIFVSDAGVLLD